MASRDLLPVNAAKIVNISGQRFGKLVVVEPAGVRRYRNGMAVYFRCRCDCGGVILAQRSNLRRATRCCGCTHPPRATTGGRNANHPLRATWGRMIERCYTPTCRDYVNYGARGIAVAERWRTGQGDLAGLECFAIDMGEKPFPGATLERRDNDQGYGPENCFWADRTTQGRNKRNNRLVTYRGETMPLSAWCERLGLPYFTTSSRLRKLGWSAERAFTEPHPSVGSNQ